MPGEGQGRRDTQHAPGLHRLAGGQGVGIIQVLQQPPHPLQVGQPGVRGAHLAGGARQQADPEPCLQVLHQPGHRGGAAALAATGPGKASGIDHRDEGSDAGKLVHGLKPYSQGKTP